MPENTIDSLLNAYDMENAAAAGRIPDGVLSMLSNAMAPASSSSGTLEALDTEILALRQSLADSLARKEALLNGRGARPLDRPTLEKFFERWPRASIHVCDGALRLIASAQSMSFHVSRDGSAPNNGVLYVGMPTNGYAVSFQNNGEVSVCAVRNELSPLLPSNGGEERRGGHPNAVPGEDSVMFSSVCTGDNRFMSDYQDFYDEPTAERWMLCLNDAMEWMTCANLSDMYGTPLWRRTRPSEWHLSDAARERTDALLRKIVSMFGSMPDRDALAELILAAQGADVVSATVRELCSDVLGGYGIDITSPTAMSLLRRYLMAAWYVARPEILENEFHGHRRDCLMWAMENDVAYVEGLSMNRAALVSVLSRMMPELGRTEEYVSHSVEAMLWRIGSTALNDHPMVGRN